MSSTIDTQQTQTDDIHEALDFLDGWLDMFCGGGGFSEALKQALLEIADATETDPDYLFDEVVQHAAINHDETAVEAFKANHPHADVYHDDVQNIKPRDIFDDPSDCTGICGGIECTHYSTARGGKPVSEQARTPAFTLLHYVQRLQPDYLLLENVAEFESWGPIEDGQPSRNGEIFNEWVDMLNALGYSLQWKVINAANFGDPTTRRRLFIMGVRNGTPTFPSPTHSEDGVGDTDSWQTAADIIDWTDRGGSIFTRDIDAPRKKPLKNTTMQRIAEGIRRHCDERLSPLADALGELGREDIKRMRNNPIPLRHADAAATHLDSPFLVHRGREAPDDSNTTEQGVTDLTPSLTKYYGTSSAIGTQRPLDTVTAGGLKYGLSVPTLMGQHSGSVPRLATESPTQTVASTGNLQLSSLDIHNLEDRGTPSLIKPRNGAYRDIHSNPLKPADQAPLHTVTAKNHDGHLVSVDPTLIRYSHGGAALETTDPMPTVATERGGVFCISDPSLVPLYNGRPNQRPRNRAVSRPLMTVPASKSPAGLMSPMAKPFIDDYEGRAQTPDEPLKTVTSRDRFALVVPELYPLGLDVRYRMLKPIELARAQGFPDDYTWTDTKTGTTELIGNAVPVNTAKRLFISLLTDGNPALSDFFEASTDPESVDLPNRGAPPRAVSDD